ncbi:MAG: dephospho-CoA kinase, partial [Nitrospirota bacterium]
MILVGLTGGIASGKSLTANILRSLGAYLLDADEISHELIKRESPVWRDIVDRFGTDILREDKEIDRPSLARIIFSDQEKRLELNAILHPRIFTEEERRRKEIAGRDPSAIVV